mmetsp:Transcript_3297/g.6407  ORF Transcript_3297/g.6407 Transcript_3297/m.6407 type:complete len:375 (+) Transcript_3297:82-1206(+)
MSLTISHIVRTICGWPTDTVSIDYKYDDKAAHARGNDACTSSTDVDACASTTDIRPHTVLLFVPGNPGCIGWYTKLLVEAVRRLGRGYAARGISYAGHGVGESIVGSETCNDADGRDNKISWTVDGQVEHKIEWIDMLSEDFGGGMPMPRFIFVSHSIGSHLVQKICCFRLDILQRSDLFLHLMPFIRFDPYPPSKKTVLSTVARSPDAAVRFLWAASKVASTVPKPFLDKCMKYLAGVDDDEGRQLALKLVCQPRMAKNFLTLGLEEIRKVPERHDDESLRILGRYCPTHMLFCGGPDQWAPHFHIEDLNRLRLDGKLPTNIQTEYFDSLVHDFIVHPEMLEPVIGFICRHIRGLQKTCSDDHYPNCRITSKL